MPHFVLECLQNHGLVLDNQDRAGSILSTPQSFYFPQYEVLCGPFYIPALGHILSFNILLVDVASDIKQIWFYTGSLGRAHIVYCANKVSLLDICGDSEPLVDNVRKVLGGSIPLSSTISLLSRVFHYKA